jgi:outer membrane protein assembly factor BamB
MPPDGARDLRRTRAVLPHHPRIMNRHHDADSNHLVGRGGSAVRGEIPTLALAVLVVAGATTPAADWPQFRGPNGSATSTNKNLPVEWGAGKNVAWKVKVPGYGWSSPVVWGDKVFVTTAVADKQDRPTGSGNWRDGFSRKVNAVYQWEVYCHRAADGTVLWKRTVAKRKPIYSVNTSNTYASETPVTDGQRVYAYFGETGVFCFDHAGNQLWHKELGVYPTFGSHGPGASPVLDGERLFIQCDNDQKSFLVALEVKTGKELWRVARAEPTGWSTPLVWKNKVRTEVVCLGSKQVRSYDPDTGQVLWQLTGTNAQCFGSPVGDADLLYAGTGGQLGGGRPLFAVKAGRSGDINLKPGTTSNESIAWSLPRAGPLMATPLLCEGHLYVLEQNLGQVACYDARTGKQVYRERLPQARGFFASPWAYQGKVFCLDEGGQTFVLQAGPEYKLLGQNNVGETCWASPALAGGSLFLRTIDHLYCIKNKP